MNNTIDYIFVDYLDYIITYSPLVSIGFFIACILYKPLYSKRKVVLGFLIFIALTFFSNIIYVHIRPGGSVPHYNCTGKFETEAANIAAAIADYFAIPSRTQIPNYSDLVNSGSYTLLENMDLKRREKLIKESEFSVTIMGDVSEIIIVLSSKEGKCPFYRWKCPYSKGEIYVKRMSDSERSEGWLESWEEI